MNKQETLIFFAVLWTFSSIFRQKSQNKSHKKFVDLLS